MKINNFKSIIFFAAVFVLGAAGVVRVLAAPSNGPGVGSGALGIDTYGNVSIGTSTGPNGAARMVVVASSTAASYSLKVFGTSGLPIFTIDNSGNVTTTGAFNANTLSGNLSGVSLGAAYVAGGDVFGRLTGSPSSPFAFAGNLGVNTSTQVGLPQPLSVYGNGYVSGSVGIGTTGPSYPLDVNGVARATTIIDSGVTSQNCVGTNSAGQLQAGTCGTVTNVGSGSGLTGGPITGSGTLSVAAGGVTFAMMAQNGCTSNQVPQWNGSSWVCGSTGGTGTVTSVGSGAGLTGGPITGSGSISLNLNNANTWTATQTFPNIIDSGVTSQNCVGTNSAGQLQAGTCGGTSQWTTSSSNIYYNSGNVGIGTTGPSQKLDVNGNINVESGNAYMLNSGTAIAGGVLSSWLIAGANNAGVYGNYNNIAIGSNALQAQNSSGYNTVGIGTRAGYLATSAVNDVFIGADAGNNAAQPTSISNSTVIGNGAYATASNQVVIGSSSVTSTLLNGNVGIGTTAPQAMLDVRGVAYAANVSGGIILGNNYNTSWNTPIFIKSDGSGNPRLALAGPGRTEDLTITNQGTVGIGVTNPAAKFDVNGQVTTEGNIFIDYGVTVDGLVVGTGRGSDALIVGNLASGAYDLLDLDNAGANEFKVTSAGTVVVAGGTGKITAGTYDPAYTIDGAKYATYDPGMTGQKEETSDVVNLTCGAAGAPCADVLDFGNAAKGSDLWLFAQVTNLSRSGLDKLTVLLAPSFDGRVWYQKDAAHDTLTIYGVPSASQIGNSSPEVSYRLTAPRFDSSDCRVERDCPSYGAWGNVRTDSAPGLIVNN